MIGRAAAAWRLLRPRQWVKNAFVLAGVFFSARWRDGASLRAAALAFGCFCLLSSAAYCLNDFIDLGKDRANPRKRHRPLASGALPPAAAPPLAAALAGLALWAGFAARPALGVLLAAYLALNLLYSLWLKGQVLVDVFCIALGFMLRMLAGTRGLGIPPSEWLILCTLMVSLFLGFSKRYAEMIAGDADGGRAVLREYSPELLRLLLGITAAAAIMTYGLYTVSPRTVEAHHTTKLVYTLPIAVFGLLRYLLLVLRGGFGEDTAAEVVRDPQLLATGAAYALAVAALLSRG